MLVWKQCARARDVHESGKTSRALVEATEHKQIYFFFIYNRDDIAMRKAYACNIFIAVRADADGLDRL